MTSANITDRSGVNMVEYCCDVKKTIPSPENPIDGGYTGQNFADTIRGVLRAEIEVVKQNEHHIFLFLLVLHLL